ncbi:MAG: hypothetical protein ACO25B_00730 [Chitinophagaceae bacterium]
MKKIYTLLLSVGMLSLAQAQPGVRDQRFPDRRDDRVFIDRTDDSRYDDYRDDFDHANRSGIHDRFAERRLMLERRKNMEIARIQQDYDFRIQLVSLNFFLSRWEKQRKIEFLEEQCRREIRMIYFKYRKMGLMGQPWGNRGRHH